MGRRRRTRPGNLGVLPLTSMIDIVFLLLIYFLVTTNFREPETHLSSRVQPEGAGSAASDLQPQIIDIVRNGDMIEYRIGARAVTDRASLARILEQLPKGPGVAVRSAADVPIREVAAVLQTCEDAGITKRSYVPRDHG